MKPEDIYDFTVVHYTTKATVCLGPRAIDSWPWWKRWAWLIADFFSEHLVPPLLIAASVTCFRLAFYFSFK